MRVKVDFIDNPHSSAALSLGDLTFFIEEPCLLSLHPHANTRTLWHLYVGSVGSIFSVSILCMRHPVKPHSTLGLMFLITRKVPSR
jgi:hypothetical protein